MKQLKQLMKHLINPAPVEPDAPVTKREKALVGLTALWAIAVVCYFCGCAAKTRNVEIKGMFTQAESATVAIGYVDVMASPTNTETAIIKYGEDTALLSPSTKTHEFKIMLTGTNSVRQVGGIVADICKAFVPTAAIVNGAGSAGSDGGVGSVGSAGSAGSVGSVGTNATAVAAGGGGGDGDGDNKPTTTSGGGGGDGENNKPTTTSGDGDGDNKPTTTSGDGVTNTVSTVASEV